MKKVLILGATGMLGSALYRQLKDSHEILLGLRHPEKYSLLADRYGAAKSARVIPIDANQLLEQDGAYEQDFLREVGDVDGVVNCIGISSTASNAHPEETMRINAELPRRLGRCFPKKLIHISTDAVFDGKGDAPYSEHSAPNPIDLYGRSKLAGEAPQSSLVLRTSIIGPEIEHFTSLLEWMRRQSGTVSGYTHALWNGMTTFELARVCRDIIDHPSSFPRTGLYHLFSTDISKYEMLKKIAHKYRIDARVEPDDSVRADRRLSTVRDLCGELEIPDFDTMLAALP